MQYYLLQIAKIVLTSNIKLCYITCTERDLLFIGYYALMSISAIAENILSLADTSVSYETVLSSLRAPDTIEIWCLFLIYLFVNSFINSSSILSNISLPHT